LIEYIENYAYLQKYSKTLDSIHFFWQLKFASPANGTRANRNGIRGKRTIPLDFENPQPVDQILPIRLIAKEDECRAGETIRSMASRRVLGVRSPSSVHAAQPRSADGALHRYFWQPNG